MRSLGRSMEGRKTRLHIAAPRSLRALFSEKMRATSICSIKCSDNLSISKVTKIAAQLAQISTETGVLVTARATSYHRLQITSSLISILNPLGLIPTYAKVSWKTHPTPHATITPLRSSTPEMSILRLPRLSLMKKNQRVISKKCSPKWSNKKWKKKH